MADSQELQTIEGTVERITFYNEENGYTVARFQPRRKSYLITIVGNLMSVNVGGSLRLEGRWTTHAQYGRQFEVESYTVQMPATIEGIRKYLGSGLIKGVGPVTAERIVDHFGLDTLDIIETEPGRLIEVPGVGRKRVAMIEKAWAEQQSIKEIMLFLQAHNVTTGLAVKIYKQYGDAAVNVVRNDPYRLARDVYGIGFVTADKIAQAIGIAHDAPERVAAGVQYVLSSFGDDGHVFARRPQLVQAAANILEVDPDRVEWAIDQLEDEGEVRVEDEAVYLRPFYYAETGVANRLRTMLNVERSRLAFYKTADWDRVFRYLDARTQFPLTQKQQAAVRTALTEKVSILTGGPGTGKTFSVRTIIRLLQARQKSVLLAAPTGRAAKRLSETTGEPAQTLHRLLEFAPHQGFKFLRDRDNPLDADMIIVDEASMIDLLLMNALLKAVDVTSHLLFVGDVDQLPPVGAGNVLRDMIDSGVVPTVALDTIFRQAADSYIIVNAHRINQGELPVFSPSSRDFFLFPHEDPEEAAERVLDLVARRIPRKFGYNAVQDIQVLSPMYRGAAGVGMLNERLQATLNPPGPAKPETQYGSRIFRQGDKVMQIRNNYEKDVFNGDMGLITRVNREDQILTVGFDSRPFDGAQDRPVDYEFNELDELLHAFTVSIHKSQGSEYPAVVIPILTQHYMMLQRNLLYTAVTRARELVVLVGTKKAIAIAVRNDKVADRNSGLAGRLREPFDQAMGLYQTLENYS
ncbi:MAG: ATP-dependent RecD-like DNA helicase [Anaerolineae bacterium]